MSKKIPAAVATLTLWLLALAPAAAQANSVSVSITGGNTLQVVGDDDANEITVYQRTDPECPGGSPCYLVINSVLTASAPCVVAGTPGTSDARALCPASGVTGVAMFGRGGNDILVAARTPRANIRGGAGSDGIIGSSKADTLYGNSGPDQIFGARGNDTIIGGRGNDIQMVGSVGDDLLKGNAGNDDMDGKSGHDRCIGGPGRDTSRHCEQVISVP